jgi:hypothetical protein
MSDVIKVIRKGGMKNREINESIKDAMDLIMKNREEKKKKDEEERVNLSKATKISESEQVLSDFISNLPDQPKVNVFDENPETKNE